MGVERGWRREEAGMQVEDCFMLVLRLWIWGVLREESIYGYVDGLGRRIDELKIDGLVIFFLGGAAEHSLSWDLPYGRKSRTLFSLLMDD